MTDQPHPQPVRLSWGWMNTGQAQLEIEDDQGRTIAKVRMSGAVVGGLLASRSHQPGTAQLYERGRRSLGRPTKGTPEWELWTAAIDVATDAPARPGQYVAKAQIGWPRIKRLRAALEAVGIDWRKAKAADS